MDNILVFPEYLRDNKYKNRSITFSCLKNGATNGGVLEDIQNVASKAKDVVSQAIGVQIPDDHMEEQGRVVLPYPSSLADTQSHSWSQEEDGAYKVLHTAQSELADPLVEGLASRVKLKGLNTDKLLATAAHSLGKRKPMLTPGYFQNYTGSSPRTISMSYYFLPKSKKEAATVKQIIMWFKKYASPWVTEFSAIMLAPYCFNIDFSGNPDISQMYNIRTCVLTSIAVDYQAADTSQLFQDGFPKYIGLSLSFTETTITFANNYEEAEASAQQSGSANVLYNNNHSMASPPINGNAQSRPKEIPYGS